VLVSRIDRLLARTDPFDLSQAVERHVRSLSGDRIRALLRAAEPRLGAYYRDEFARLTGSGDFETALSQRDAVLQTAFVKFLKSNLRAIPIFGSPFGLAVLEHAPLDRAVGIGEERASPLARGALVGGAALALVLAGAAGEHVVAARVAAQTPQPVVVVPPATVGTPAPHPRVAAASPAPTRPRAIARVSTSYVPTPVPTTVSEPMQPAASDPAPAEATAPPPRPTPSPPSGVGVVEVTAAPQTPSPQPSDLDVTDMPESYSDATPLPQQSPATAQVPARGIKVPTPKPSPKKRTWLHRALDHLNPFKP
jgi:hypothetical protein